MFEILFDATPSTYDRQGRITLPPSLVNYAKLDKDVLIIGMVNKMEIWNPRQLEMNDEETLKIDSTEYDNLAEKITL